MKRTAVFLLRKTMSHGIMFRNPTNYLFILIWMYMYFTCLWPDKQVEAYGNHHYTLCPDKCQCDFRLAKVACINTQFTDVKVFGKLPEHTREVIFTGNFIPEIPSQLLGECNSSYTHHILLDKLDLSNNSIMTIRSDSFTCMRRLKSLKLNYNHWEIKNHTGVFSKLVSLEKLELRNSFLPLVNSTEHMKQLGETFKEAKMPELQELHLEQNNIKHVTSDDFHTFCPLRKLKKLYLSHNFIAHPGIDPSCAENLEELHLNNNSIPFLSDAMIKVAEVLPELTLLNISDNPFVCDCQVDNFYHFLKTTILLLEVETLKCVAGYPVSNVGRKIVDLRVTDFRCKDVHTVTTKLNASYIIMGCIFGILFMLFLIVMYLNRAGIKRTISKCTDPFTATYSSMSL